MIDRTKAFVAAAALVIAVLLVGSVGFIAGRASGDTNDSEPPRPLDGDGLPNGPVELDNGVPVGFAANEEGALAAAAAWAPWLLSGPAADRPEGINAVLAAGVEAPGGDDLTARFQFLPIAAKVEMEGDEKAVVTLLGPVLQGDLGAELTGEVWKVPIDLEWDSSAADWRIAAFPSGASGDYLIDGALDAADVEGFQAVRTAGIVEGPAIVEAVPGE